MKLKKVSSKQMILFLGTKGIFLHHKKGSHNVLIKAGCFRIVVPQRKELPIGTTLAILRESNITKGEFLDFVEKRKVKKRRNQNV